MMNHIRHQYNEQFRKICCCKFAPWFEFRTLFNVFVRSILVDQVHCVNLIYALTNCWWISISGKDFDRLVLQWWYNFDVMRPELIVDVFFNNDRWSSFILHHDSLTFRDKFAYVTTHACYGRSIKSNHKSTSSMAMALIQIDKNHLKQCCFRF